MPIISGTDLASYPGIDPSLSPDHLEWIADQVSALVEEAWRSQTWPVPTWVTTIALNAAARFARNPRGLESYTTSVDDGSHTQRIRSTGAPDGLGLTDDEVAALSAIPASAAGTIQTSPVRTRRGYW